MKFIANPWPLSESAVKICLALSNLWQVILPVILAYMLGVYRPEFVSNGAFLFVMFICAVGGYALTRVHGGWFPSGLGYFTLLIAIACFLGADLASGRDSTSFEVAVSMIPGVILVVLILLLRPKLLKGWVPHVASMLPIPIVIYVVLPEVFPLVELRYVGANPMELLFGAFLNSGFIVLNIKACYTKGDWTLNDVFDFTASNVKGFFQWIFRGKIKFEYKQHDDNAGMNRTLELAVILTERALALYQLDAPNTDGKSDPRKYLIQAAIEALPDGIEGRVRAIVERRKK